MGTAYNTLHTTTLNTTHYILYITHNRTQHYRSHCTLYNAHNILNTEPCTLSAHYTQKVAICVGRVMNLTDVDSGQKGDVLVIT